MIYRFKWITWTANITIASNVGGILKIQHENQPHLLYIDRIRVPIALTKLFSKIIELLSYDFTEFTVKQKLKKAPKYQKEWWNQIDQIRIFFWLFCFYRVKIKMKKISSVFSKEQKINYTILCTQLIVTGIAKVNCKPKEVSIEIHQAFCIHKWYWIGKSTWNDIHKELLAKIHLLGSSGYTFKIAHLTVSNPNKYS